MARGNGENKTQECPICTSPFDSGRYQLYACAECGAEGSSACCMAPRVAGQQHSENCIECDGD